MYYLKLKNVKDPSFTFFNSQKRGEYKETVKS